MVLNLNNFFIDTLWSGHIESIEVVDSELVEIIDCLGRFMVSKDVKSENRVQAHSFFHQVCDSVFILFNKFLCEYLHTVNVVKLTF